MDWQPRKQRPLRTAVSVMLTAVMAVTGCAPTQPFYFMEDGDLSHYVDVATQIEYPDVEEPSLDEVTGALAPLTLRNADDYEMWDVTLEEATRITLTNSQVLRQLGGVVADQAPETISRNLINSVAVATTFDPALVESATGTAFGSAFNGTGVEAALSAFDAQLDSAVTWAKNDRPQNATQAIPFQAPVLEQDTGVFNLGVSKIGAAGTQVAFRNNTLYEFNNAPFRAVPSDWNTNFEAFISQPLLQGRGAQYNRIAGPQTFDQYAQGGVNPFDGVIIARLRTDQTLADFEGAVRNVMRDVEQAYWNLYFSYRDLEARKIGRDSALQTWKTVAALARQGARGGSADREAQARAQYFQFKAQVEQGLSSLYTAENRLRYLMGLAVSDGRLIRPSDEPSTAPVAFDWSTIHNEALVRRVEVRKQKWSIKQREMELIAARNHLLPRLDGFGTYRWVGAGDNLFDQNPAAGALPFGEGRGAFDVLTGGDFAEWELGLRFSLPIGFRQELSTVRHHQLLLARERALLQDLELEVSHQLGDALRDLDLQYGLTETNFNRRSAAQREVEAVQTSYEADRVTLDLLLQAQQRRAEAETAYFRSLVDYNLAITDVHFRKGSLLEYNGVLLAEGPWPGKAYFDAMRRARQRDASVHLDYGYTRPNVLSRGAHGQRMEFVPAGVEQLGAPAPTPATMEDGVELIQPEPVSGPLSSVPSKGPTVDRPLFAAPWAGEQTTETVAGLVGGPTGYEAEATGTSPVNAVGTPSAPSAGVRLASAIGAAIGEATSAVHRNATHHETMEPVRRVATPVIGYERQAGYTTDRVAPTAPVGAGR